MELLPRAGREISTAETSCPPPWPFRRSPRMDRYSTHGPVASEHAFAIVRAICEMWSRSCIAQTIRSVVDRPRECGAPAESNRCAIWASSRPGTRRRSRHPVLGRPGLYPGEGGWGGVRSSPSAGISSSLPSWPQTAFLSRSWLWAIVAR